MLARYIHVHSLLHLTALFRIDWLDGDGIIGDHIPPLIISILFIIIVVVGTPLLVYCLLFSKLCFKSNHGASPATIAANEVISRGVVTTAVGTVAGASASTIIVTPRKDTAGTTIVDTSNALLTNAARSANGSERKGPQHELDLSFLFRPYSLHRPYWELIVIARRLALVLILVVWSHNDIMRSWLMIICIYAFTYAPLSLPYYIIHVFS
jgi:hypothetical protein